MIQADIKISCFIELEDDSSHLYMNILNNNITTTLQYSDITEELNDFIEVNEYFEIYENEEELINDLEKGHIQRFLGQQDDNDTLDLLVNLRMKMQHKNGICDNSCILCNPDIKEDPFPDFMFNLRNIKPEGEV